MDRFRKNYTPVMDEQKALVKEIKEKAEELEALYANAMGLDARCCSTAITRLEESVMWAVKAATTEIPQSAGGN